MASNRWELFMFDKKSFNIQDAFKLAIKNHINKKFKELEHLLSTQHVDNNSESVRQLADSVVTLLTDIHQLLVG